MVSVTPHQNAVPASEKANVDPADAANAVNSDATAAVGTNGAAPTLSLSILTEVRAAQGAHGLKLGGDFQRYRRYCTRRIGRVRRASSNTNGRNRYDAKPITADSVRRDSRALLIPLYCAERAWAYAMDIKRSPPSGPARARRTVVARLSKATAHASHLRSLCVDAEADSDTCLEAEAYARWMNATLALEREGWASALADFERAHTIYNGLAGVRAGTAAAGVFEERVDEIASAMRFCRYNIAQENGNEGSNADVDADLRGLAAGGGLDELLAEKIEVALAAARKRAAVSFGDVEWCGRVIELKSEVVREALLKVKEEIEALEKRTDAREPDHYDKLFISYSDAAKVVQNEIKQFREATAARAEERIAELEMLAAYLSYGRLTHTVDRNKLLVEAALKTKRAKPDDLVRLYDNLVHNLTDIAELRGVSDDAEKAMRVDAQRSLFRAHRCFHLARCYLVAGMHSAAEQLFERASHHAKSLSGGGEFAQEASKLMRDAEGLRVRARAQIFLREAKLAREMSIPIDKRCMCDNLDEFVSYAKQSGHVQKIAQLPPALEAVPCKPVLFDLALDGIAFPGDKEKEEAQEAKVKKEQEEQAPKPVAKPEPVETSFGARLGRWWSGKG